MAGVKNLISRWLIPPGFMGLYVALQLSRGRKKAYTREERALLKENILLKDRHVGHRCFILGSGSSIKQQDLTKLAGEIIISVSNSFVHPAIPLIKPKYHVLPPVLARHGELNTVEKFMEWFYEMDKKTFDAEMFFHIWDRNELIKRGLYKNRIVHWVDYAPWDEGPIGQIELSKMPNIWSVSEAAITIAIYLGFSKIYLLGFDHDWFNGIFNYFYDEKKDHILQPDAEKLRFADSEFQMRRHAYIFKKYKYLYAMKKNIYNLNADHNSYVDVFPKVSYDEILKHK